MTLTLNSPWRAAVLATAIALATSISALAQTVPVSENAQSLLDRDDAVFLMLDHQAGLMQIVEDIDQTQLRANVAALSMVADFFDIPVIASTSVPQGPNGPLIPEVVSNAPSATVIDRAGPINAWDDERIRAAVEATGRNTIIITTFLVWLASWRISDPIIANSATHSCVGIDFFSRSVRLFSNAMARG